ncbi:MAG TPA: DUF2339 domain-containing protein [Propionibacteriaceae bacterium]
MTQMPPEEQLRHLLAKHDRLLAETAQQNREMHEWAVRFGPRPVQTMPTPSYPPPMASAPSFPPPRNPPQLSWATAHPPSVAPFVQQEPPEPTKPSLSSTQIIARLVAGAGALVTLVGIAFILVLAAQYGYFGPAPRTISAAGLGVVLSAGAFVLHRRDPDNAGGPALLATGMAAGFLSLVAGTTLYHLMPGALGLVLAGLLGIAVSVVAALWRSEWLACLAVAAALVIGPWVSGDVHLGAAFMVVLSAVASIAHLRMRWPVFHLARTLPTTVLLVSLASVYGLATNDAWLLVALSGVHAVMAVLSALLGRRAPEPEQWALASVFVGPTIPLLVLAGSELPRLQGAWVAVVAAALYVLVAMFPGTKDWLKATAVALAGIFAVTTVALATDLSLLAVLLPGLAVAYVAAAASLRSQAVGLVALVGSGVGIVSWLGYGVPAAFGIRFQDVLIGSLLIALLAVLGHWAARRILQAKNPDWLRYGLIAFGLLGSAAAVTSVGFLLGRAVGSATSIHQASSVVVTVGWALASVVVLRQPLRSSDHSAGWIRLGLGLAAAATGKLFLVDLALLPGLARGVAFLLVGLLLLALGISYAKAYERARGETPPPAPPTA